MEENDKLDLVNRIYSCFLQAMEFDPRVQLSTGVGANHTQHTHNTEISEHLTPLDLRHAEDMVIIACEVLYEVKKYDFSVFNPINFQIVVMAEYGMTYFPDSIPLRHWLLKMYAKLGLVSLVNEICENFPELNDQDHERLGAFRYSVYTDFGMETDLDELITTYRDFYTDTI